MIYEVITYDVKPALKHQLLARFQDHALRIMRERYGFALMWMGFSLDLAKTRFVYQLAWTGYLEMARAWPLFLKDEEWQQELARSRAEHGEPVINFDSVIVEPIDQTASSCHSSGKVEVVWIGFDRG